MDVLNVIDSRISRHLYDRLRCFIRHDFMLMVDLKTGLEWYLSSINSHQSRTTN